MTLVNFVFLKMEMNKTIPDAVLAAGEAAPCDGVGISVCVSGCTASATAGSEASIEGPTRVKGLVARPNAKGSIVHMLHVYIIQRWVAYTQFSQDRSKTRDVCLDA